MVFEVISNFKLRKGRVNRPHKRTEADSSWGRIHSTADAAAAFPICRSGSSRSGFDDLRQRMGKPGNLFAIAPFHHHP